jgi:hypothetical protein
MLAFIRAEDRLTGLAALRPDLIIIQNYPPDAPVVFADAEYFEEEYLPVKVFREPYFPYAVVIFQRQP